MELTLFTQVLQEYTEKVKALYNDKIANEVYKNDWKRIASGELIKSVQTTIEVNDVVYSVVFDANDYYYYIENGRSKGRFPPPDAILNWIRVKRIIPRERNGKLPTEKQLAFLIGRKIAREGYEGNKPLERTIEELNIIYLPLLQQALQADFENEVAKLLHKVLK